MDRLGLVILGTLACSSAPVFGALNASVAEVSSETFDLTASGSLDWAIWGVGEAGSPADLAASSRKDNGEGAGVGLIPDPVDLNDLQLGDPLYTCGGCNSFDTLTSFSWTGGVPIAESSDSSGGLLFRRQGEGGGFSLSIPADSTTRRLQLFVSTYRATGILEATLSDNSGGYTDSSLTQQIGFTDTFGVYTFDFSSPVAETTFDVSFSILEDLGTFENVGLLAASLNEITTAPLDGDYTGDGVVDAADYTVWRDTLGETGEGLAADGDNDQMVGQSDYDLWAANYGAPSAEAVAVPEPASLGLLAGFLLAGIGPRKR